jgi:hypothetical protein
MAILCSDIVNRLNAMLDAESSDRYLWVQDFKPSISGAIDFAVTLFNSIFGQNKLSEEVLKDLIRTRVYQASKYSRITFNGGSTNDLLWSTLGVHVNITVTPNTIIPLGELEDSILIPNVTFLEAEESCKRLTIEEWSFNSKNPFKKGNSIITSINLKRYAYLNFSDYRGSTLITSPNELTIRPSVANEFVALTYLKAPTYPVNITDSIEFPQTMTDFIVAKSLDIISTKQGDQTNLYTIEQRDINKLVTLFS